MQTLLQNKKETSQRDVSTEGGFMDKEIRILMLEDVATDAELIERELRQAGIPCSLKRVETRADFVKGLEGCAPDIILADYTLPSFDGMAALSIARERCPAVPFIFVSGTIGEELAIDALTKGAMDYVYKNRLLRLAPAVQRALREIRSLHERKRADEALKESEERFRTIVASAKDAIICMRAPGTIYLWNKKAEEMFGYPAAEAMGRELHVFIAPERYQEKARAGLTAFFQTGTGAVVGKTVEVYALRKDGTEFPIELSISPMQIHGEWHATAIIRDITERRQSDAKLKQQVEELERFKKATIQREIRMKELRDKLGKLS